MPKGDPRGDRSPRPQARSAILYQIYRYNALVQRILAIGSLVCYDLSRNCAFWDALPLFCAAYRGVFDKGAGQAATDLVSCSFKEGGLVLYIQQISVFMENSPGKLAAFTRLLGEASIDLISLSIADTTNFGILRCIVDDYERTVDIIAKAGYTVRLTEVLGAVVADRPGGLAEVLAILSEEGISIEYLYSFVRNAGKNALLVFRVEELERAAAVLTAHGVTLISQEQVRTL